MPLLFSDNEIITSTISNYFDRKLKRYGDPKYAYMILNKKNPAEMMIISNYPDEWVEIYKANNYQHIDPVVLTAFNKIAPFSWDENIVISSNLKMSKIFTLSRKYNIVNGFTFVLHDQANNLAMLSLMMDDKTIDDLEETIERNRDKLQMLLITAHDKMHSLYKEMMENQNIRHPGEKEIFSARENEILYWASMGKTYQEISLIMGITTSTVKFHIKNVVKKLGVLNAKHAIRLGIELQLIKPVLS
ncbi:LuxR family transcriptional regulator [Pantoea sp. 1.19]|uniref:helix-turn-helix transcriptional regulator n=1 Tax=Pantoea sp. 1.19 TaxID=1925589 RepID=UPI000948D9B2|nr:LuxR family transcriptional regulator [Pantoea sp. 1.19]